MRTRISRDEALSFILTYIIVEKSTAFQLDQLSLFSLTNLASQAAQKLSDEAGLIPHEVIEEIVAPFLNDIQFKQST
jgi:Tol biopolymer transport system component